MNYHCTSDHQYTSVPLFGDDRFELTVHVHARCCLNSRSMHPIRSGIDDIRHQSPDVTPRYIKNTTHSTSGNLYEYPVDRSPRVTIQHPCNIDTIDRLAGIYIQCIRSFELPLQRLIKIS